MIERDIGNWTCESSALLGRSKNSGGNLEATYTMIEGA